MTIPTPYETTGTRTDTLDAELQFYADLLAASPRVAMESVGTSSVNGRDMWLVRIGYPTPPPAPTAGTPNSLLITASIHGNEYMAREAALELIRDLAFTDDPDLIAYLSAHPVYIMPTCNPDRIETAIRNNLAWVDLNRDHFALTQGETQAIWTAIQRVRPVACLDMHEYATDRTTHLAPIPASHPQVPAATLAATAAWQASIDAAVVGDGWTTGPYTFASVTLPVMLCNAAALATSAAAFTPETSTREPEVERLAVQRVAARAAIEHHRLNAASMKAHQTQARIDAQNLGGQAREAYRLMDSPTVLMPPPTAYRITTAQRDSIALQRAAFPITTVPDGDDWLVPMAQAAQPVIPLVLDPESPYVVTVGQRVYQQPPMIGASWGPVRAGGMTCEVTSVQYRIDGELRPLLSA